MGDAVAGADAEAGRSDPRREPLTRDGRRDLDREHVAALLQLALSLAAGRTLGWWSAWLSGGVILPLLW
ncbi:MAG: hypothetical protein ACFCGT_06525 [Sandaracinaceae bacterium]